MIKKITQILCGVSILVVGLLVQVGTVGAFGCEYTEAGRTACVPSSATNDRGRALSDCLVQTCSSAARTGCKLVTDCASRGALPPAAASGTGAASSKKSKDVKAQVVVLNNPIAVRDIQGLIGSVVGKSFGLIGTLAIIAFIYGGFLWLTAAGNEEKVKKGGQVMVYATVGIIVIFSSYAILNTVLQGLTSKTFLQDTNPATAPSGVATARPIDCADIASLGYQCQPITNCKGVIEAKYVDIQRSQCNASGGTCWTGACSSPSKSEVCCQSK